jgi:predicted secreted hydrolase
MAAAPRLAPGTGLLAGVLVAVALVGAGLAVVIARAGRATDARPVRATLSVGEALGRGGGEGFARALAPRRFAFPADHGPHPEFRTEWWYWTGNLVAREPDRPARPFGFQLTFFRSGLVPAAPARASAWAARDVYLAHFAVTDVAGRRFHAADRWARGALELAGAGRDPFRVWLGDWTATGEGPRALPMRLRAGDGPVAIDLALGSAKPPVLQGERGLSRKSAEPGNASYYYSLTRMPVTGEVRLDGRALAVEGLAWMDREWGTSALAADQVGWDWFALQLDDGRDLMVYRLRRRDGTVDPASQGSLVGVDGAVRLLAAADVAIDVTEHWTSPRRATRYPAGWRLRVPAARLELRVTPRLPDQELDVAIRYWEGAVEVQGTAAGRPVGGAGYVELVGYAGGDASGAVRQ